MSARASRSARRVAIRPVRSSVTYAIALHEIGHILATQGYGRLERERETSGRGRSSTPTLSSGRRQRPAPWERASAATGRGPRPNTPEESLTPRGSYPTHTLSGPSKTLQKLSEAARCAKSGDPRRISR